MTSRKASGTDGYDLRVLVAGVVALGIFTAVINVLDVISIAHGEPQYGVFWPVIWEGSAGLAILPAALIPWVLLKYAPPDRPLWRTILTFTVAAPLFSVVHVSLFVAMRAAVYAIAGGTYQFGPIVQNFEYEASKDVFGYFGAIFLFWAARRHFRALAARPATQPSYDIRDGAKLVRVRVEDILAITSAGNYVEFVLRDGRRPLMRKPLSSVEAEMAPLGFVRTHRSWLVNALQVTGLRPERSGDYAIEVGAVTVPLSRRFPDALAKLRAG